MAEQELKEELKKIEEKVVQVLKTVYDPEIPVDIYNLGLIYDIKVTAEMEVVVLMTLTAPNCPVADTIPRDVEEKIERIPEVKKAKAIMTFDPPWDMEMMSEAAKLELGFM